MSWRVFILKKCYLYVYFFGLYVDVSYPLLDEVWTPIGLSPTPHPMMNGSASTRIPKKYVYK